LKFEARNPKFETNPNDRIAKFKTIQLEDRIVVSAKKYFEQRAMELTNIFGSILPKSEWRFEHLVFDF